VARIIKKSALDGLSKKKPKGRVSIIITNYKKEAFLERAIRSCLAQTHKDIEIVVVDDCSNKKKVLEIIRSIGAKNIRFIYTTKNYGHYACCNYAMDQAAGKYVTFLGADDTIDRNHIKGLLCTLQEHRLMGVWGLYCRYFKDGSKAGKPKLCEASFLFEKDRFIRDIGYFHMVRCAADSEYRLRAGAYYGAYKLGWLQVNSYRALQLPGSLTDALKAKNGRHDYSNKFRKKLKTKDKSSLYFDYKKDSLGFSVNSRISVKGFDEKTFKEVML
jgi:glycosyltransferase involved in cell wall biosynthesis